MPHKDREERLAYLRAWKLRNRPSPVAESQGDDSMPRRGAMRFSEDGAKVQCHECGAWFRSLNTHIRTHGYDAQTYKETFGLARTASMLPPVTKDRYREASVARGQGEIGRGYLPPPTGRPKGQDARLSVRIQASDDRKGIYTRGGQKTRSKADDTDLSREPGDAVNDPLNGTPKAR